MHGLIQGNERAGLVMLYEVLRLLILESAPLLPHCALDDGTRSSDNILLASVFPCDTRSRRRTIIAARRLGGLTHHTLSCRDCARRPVIRHISLSVSFSPRTTADLNNFKDEARAGTACNAKTLAAVFSVQPGCWQHWWASPWNHQLRKTSPGTPDRGRHPYTFRNSACCTNRTLASRPDIHPTT